MPDGPRIGGRDVPIGGQAVLKGVMMRGTSTWAVAVRAPDGSVHLTARPLVSWMRRSPVLRWPVIRGAVALAEALRIGYRALRLSQEVQLRGQAELARTEGREPEEPDEVGRGTWALTIGASLLFAVGLFFVVPVVAASLLGDLLGSVVLFLAVEGLLRTGIFIGYLWMVSRSRDLHELLAYHGAEHKAIACLEAGEQLTPASAERFPRLHPRCGTSFLLIVMVLSVFVLAPVGMPAWHWLVLSRIVAIPLIAGLAYEVVRWTGRQRGSRWVRCLSWPGLMLQRLTTREPDREQLDVAIAALEGVLDVERQAGPDRASIEAVA